MSSDTESREAEEEINSEPSDNEEDEAYDPDEDKQQSRGRKRKAAPFKLESDKEKRIRAMMKTRFSNFHSVNEILAAKKVVNDVFEKRIKELRELNSSEFICPVCRNSAREGAVLMMIDKCKHVVCAVCQCQILTKAMRDYSSSRCPACRATYNDVTNLDLGTSKKVTELDVKNRIRSILTKRADHDAVSLSSDDDDDDDQPTTPAVRPATYLDYLITRDYRFLE